MKRIRIHLGNGFVSSEGPRDFWWPLDSSLSISRLIESILEGRGLQSYKRFGINASLQDFYLLPGSEASILRDEDLLILETSNANAKMDNAGIELNAKRKRLAEEKEFPPSKANQPAKVPSRSARRKAAKRRYKRLKLASNGIEAHKNESGGSHRSSMDPSTGTDKRNPVALDFDKSLQDTPRDLKLNDAMEMQYGPGRGLEYEKLELCNGMPLPNTFIAYRLLEPGADGVPKASDVRTAHVLSSDEMTGLVTLSPRETDTNVAHNVVVKVNCGSGSSVTQLSANSKDAAEDLLLLDLISFFDIRYIAKINGGRSPLQRGKVNYSKLGPPKPHVGVRESVDKNKDSLKNRAKNTRTICVKETVKKDAEKGGVLKGRRSRALQTALGPLLKLIREKV